MGFLYIAPGKKIKVYFHVFDEELIELVRDTMRESVQRSWGSMQTPVFGEKEGKE